MKSEFLLAFNEICQERGLPQETVIDALKTALVSAYRRNTNVSNTQDVHADIDPRTGEPTIYAEKEVVDSVFDNRTEVLLEVAHKEGFTDADYGDMVMVNSTPRNFGRIAAQTAKQVILQRVREAEREQLYDDFISREGEIVNGTVQSTSGGNITIGLGRTEAILPHSQQVRTERYRAHDKIRVYVLEVRRTNRGPQIYVSRNHRNLLRRLLELEVPEIYNGQVDIKSIAREAGQRSKVAVVALQSGVDPVGACVGMRGVRIQSIVRELNDEKIDVIEWDNDQRVFIAKALSPARVSSVFLEEHPDSGKTAVVIVPDDHLSLAIGREGQNARLAAKLTGWRIDIKSLTESARDSLDNLDNPAADPAVAKDEVLREQVRHIVEKKEAGRPITAEDQKMLDRMVKGVEGRIIQARAAEYEQIRKDRAAVRRLIPEEAWETELEEFNLLLSYHTTLMEADVTTVGEALYRLQLGNEYLLSIEGIGDKALEALRKAAGEYLKTYHRRREEGVPVEETADDAVDAAEEAVAETAVEAEAEATAAVEEDAEEAEPVDIETALEVIEGGGIRAVAEAAEAAAEEAEEEDVQPLEPSVAETEPAAEMETSAVETPMEAEADVVEEPEPVVAEEMAVQADVDEPAVDDDELVAEEPEPAVAEDPSEVEVDSDELVPIDPLDDLDTSLVEQPPKKKPRKPAEKKVVVVSRKRYDDGDDEDFDEEEDEEAAKRRKGRELVYDEDAGRVVARRKRKGSRRRNEWEEYEDY